jgi:hypothetical protein
MNTVVESLKRLYVKDSLTEKQIEAVKESVDKLLSDKKISIEEYNYITNK